MVRDAFARGELSYSKVRALTRIDRAQDEFELVSLARHATAAQLERIVQATRRVIAVDQVVVHVDAAVLASAETGGEQAAGRCELAAGVPLPAEAVRRLACDGSLVCIVEQDGRPLSLGRRTRSIPPALRRALQSRDGGCRFPGCTSTRHVDAHHIEHWADDGRTDLGNLVAVCRRHHRLLHEGGFRVRRQGAELAFYTPQGERLHASPRALGVTGSSSCASTPAAGSPSRPRPACRSPTTGSTSTTPSTRCSRSPDGGSSGGLHPHLRHPRPAR